MLLNSFPTSASQASPWLAQTLAADTSLSTPLMSPTTADVCIVGGGYTGLWTAIELKRRDPSLDVVLLEARVCGSGASGTNAGFLMNLWPKFPALVTHVGRAEAIRIAQATSDAIEQIIAFCSEHHIDAKISRNGWLWTSTTEDQDGAWNDTLHAIADAQGNPLRTVDPEAATELSGHATRGGVLDPTAATLQPAALARGLRRAAIEMGVRVFENTPVTGIDSSGEVSIETTDGQVTSRSAVLAINAWASAIPEIRRRLVLTASDNLITAPLARAQLAALGTEGVGTSDSRRLLNYWRSTSDGSALFGKGGVGLGFGHRGASSLYGAAPRPHNLERQFRATFPTLADVPIAATWRAPVEYSINSLPFFVPVSGQPRVFVGAGYSGDGVGPACLGGKILASLALGTDDEWSRSGLTRLPRGWLPPEPIRFVGGQLVRAALTRADNARSSGKQVDLVTTAVTKLDPTSWV